jgi:hypothetical protein
VTIETVTVNCPACLKDIPVICYRSVIGWRAELPLHQCEGFGEADRQDVAFQALERVNPPLPPAA